MKDYARMLMEAEDECKDCISKTSEKINDAIDDSDNKDEYIEQKAREKGYVKSDEIVFYDVSGSNN